MSLVPLTDLPRDWQLKAQTLSLIGLHLGSTYQISLYSMSQGVGSNLPYTASLEVMYKDRSGFLLQIRSGFSISTVSYPW